jgi:hypothetical protein
MSDIAVTPAICNVRSGIAQDSSMEAIRKGVQKRVRILMPMLAKGSDCAAILVESRSSVRVGYISGSASQAALSFKGAVDPVWINNGPL